MDLDAIFSQDAKHEMKFPTIAEALGYGDSANIEHNGGSEDFHGNSCLILDEPPVGEHKDLSVHSEPPTNMIVKETRDMMNSGKPYATMLHSLKSRYTQEALKEALPKISSQMKLYGFVGKKAIDARGYANCRKATETAMSGGPLSGSFRAIIGCTCGSKVCSVTGLKSIASANEIDDKWYDDSFEEVKNIVGLQNEDKAKIASLGKVQRFTKLAQLFDASKIKASQEETKEDDGIDTSFTATTVEIVVTDSPEVESVGCGSDVELESFGSETPEFIAPLAADNQVVEVAANPDSDLVIQEGSDLTF